MTEKTEAIAFSLYYHGTRLQCDVCGGWTEKFVVGAKSQSCHTYVCAECIKHPEGIDQTITDHVAGFRAYAEKRIAFVESLRGRLGGLPSYADLQKEEAAIEEALQGLAEKRPGAPCGRKRPGYLKPKAWAVSRAQTEGGTTMTNNDEAKAMTAEERALQGFDSYFGVCPQCHKHDGIINVGRSHWFVCHEHKIKWCVGSNLFSSWLEQTEEEQREIYDRLGVGNYCEMHCDEVYYPTDPYDGKGGSVVGPGHAVGKDEEPCPF